MEPQLGWAWLSQKERRTAEQALADLGPDGTRDELGFGAVHFAYADRFFPGTSVQHTALRYVWFVCWSYLELQQQAGGQPFPSSELDRIEDRTGRRLLAHYGNGDGFGVIGGRILRAPDRSPVTKPSAIYWNAIRSWCLVEPLTGSKDPPGRAELHARWSELTSSRPRPEIDAEAAKPLFDNVPPMPPRWRTRSEPLSFDLDVVHDEAGRIRRGWERQRDKLGRRTLLSRLAGSGVAAPASMTSRQVMSVCFDDEKVSLRRARRAGSLAAVARAIHTALVQQMKKPEQHDLQQVRGWVDDAVAEHGEPALELDLPGLLVDAPDSLKLLSLIEATQTWLKEGAGDIAKLNPVYRERETAQKPGRALLAHGGDERRASWRPRQTGPLNYRWNKVAGFLDQLAGR